MTDFTRTTSVGVEKRAALPVRGLGTLPGEAAAAAFQEASSLGLRASLAGMISAGVFASIQHGDESRCRTNRT